MTTTFRSVTVRKLAGKIKAARTHAELLDLAEASHGVMTDQQFADALADREHATEELLGQIELLCRRSAQEVPLAALIAKRIESVRG